LVDGEGKRYAKRDRALTLAELRQSGETAKTVRRLAGFS
jgi:glutamyl-Q tRNA(Asp) synthetase